MDKEEKQNLVEVDYEETISEIKDIFNKNKNITIATSLDDRVTARTVQYINEELDIYFSSWAFNKKIAQIIGNSNVALNIHNIQIEGTAEIFRWPLDDELQKISDKFSAKYKWFTQLSEDREAVIVRVKPKKIVKFKGIDGVFHLQNIDLDNKKVYQMKLADKTNPNYPF